MRSLFAALVAVALFAGWSGAQAQKINAAPSHDGVSIGFAPSTYSRATPSGFPTLPVTPTAVNCAGQGCVVTNRSLIAAFQATYSVPSGNACVSTGGNDGTGTVYGGSLPASPSCYLTIQACLNSSAGTCQINGGGDFAPFHWRSDLDAGSNNGATAKRVVAQTANLPRLRVPGDDAKTATWTQSGTYPNLWSMPATQGQPGVLRVMRPGTLDSYGFESRVPMYGLTGGGLPWQSATSGQVTTALAAANTAATGAVWDPNNNLLYVGLGGSNVAIAAAAGNLRVCWLDSNGRSALYVIGGTISVENIRSDCVGVNTQTGGTGGSPIYSRVYVTGGNWLFGGGDGLSSSLFNAQGGSLFVENARAAGAFDDVFHCDVDQFGNRGLLGEINNAGFEAGDVISFPSNASNSTPQVSSAHGGCDAFRFGATYEGTASGWQAIADTSANSMTAYSWNVGVLTNGATLGNECAGGTSGTRTCWFDVSQDFAAGGYAIYGSGTGITIKTAVIAGNATSRAAVTTDTSATATTYDPAAP